MTDAVKNKLESPFVEQVVNIYNLFRPRMANKHFLKDGGRQEYGN